MWLTRIVRIRPAMPAASHAARRERQFGLRGAGDLALLVRLDDVAVFEVLVVLEADTALEARLHLAHVLLEPLERRDRAVPDDDAVAQEAHLRPARDGAVTHEAPGDSTDTRHRDDLAHLGLAGDHFLELGLE